MNGPLLVHICGSRVAQVNSAARQIDTSPDGRQQPRTHLFVVATLYADGGSTPVHIRNMSSSGALVEGLVLPEVGCRMALRRGPLEAAGYIAWRVDRRAGVRFDAPAFVHDWMSRLVSSCQEQVDAKVSAIKANGATAAPTGSVAAPIESELMRLRADLADMGSALVGDAIVVATHPEIQTIDISLQRIDRILSRLRAGG